MEIRDILNIQGRNVLVKRGRFSLCNYNIIQCKNLEDFLKNKDYLIEKTDEGLGIRKFLNINIHFFEIKGLSVESIDEHKIIDQGQRVFGTDGNGNVLFEAYEDEIIERDYKLKQGDSYLIGFSQFVNKTPPTVNKEKLVNILVDENPCPPYYILKIQQT